jgi:hypothetical protein
MKYKMEDGIIVDTDRAKQSWKEATDWNGSNHISRATGSQWEHQELHRSRKGRYYLVHWSQVQGTMSRAEFISNEEACRWLLLMDRELPEDLKSLEGEVCE